MFIFWNYNCKGRSSCWNPHYTTFLPLVTRQKYWVLLTGEGLLMLIHTETDTRLHQFCARCESGTRKAACGAGCWARFLTHDQVVRLIKVYNLTEHLLHILLLPQKAARHKVTQVRQYFLWNIFSNTCSVLVKATYQSRISICVQPLWIRL